MIWLLAIAGGVGAVLRFLTDQALHVVGTRFPMGTLVVNLVGSFALGCLMGADPTPGWLLIGGTGLLGGFTTFSTHAVESARLVIESRRPGLAIENLVGTAVGCVALAGAGWAIAALW